MLTFRIKVRGVDAYDGIFHSQADARADAEQRWPDAPPACVLCLSRLAERRAA